MRKVEKGGIAMTVISGAIIGLVSIAIVLCVALVFVRIIRAGGSVESRKKRLAIGIVLTAFLVCGAFVFVKMHTFRLPADVDAILIRSGTTGESFEISRGTDGDVFGELISVELKVNAFSPFAALRIGHDYILTYYKNGEAVTEFIGKGGICQTYRFPFFYNTSDDISSIIDGYIENAGKTTP